MTRLRNIFGLCALLAAVVFAAAAQAQTGTPLLPDHFGSWTADGPARTPAPQELAATWPAGNDGQKVLQEAGAKKVEERTYHDGANQVTVRAFQLQDPSSAYEFYTFLLAPGTREIGVGQNAAATDKTADFQIGNLVVDATYSAGLRPEALTELAGVLKAKAEIGPLPPVKNYLPTNARVAGSEKYALGPEAFRAALNSVDQSALAAWDKEVGFANGVEAIVAKYKNERGSGTLLLLDYPTPQIAERHLHHLEEALPQAVKDAGATIERKASVLSVALAPSSKEYAQKLRDEINFDTSVTWNEPHQTATDPPWVLILSKIFIMTGAFLGVATGLGLAFGGVRIITKRLFPGKVFDRPESIEVLQMGLSGKKIDPSDMY